MASSTARLTAALFFVIARAAYAAEDFDVNAYEAYERVPAKSGKWADQNIRDYSFVVTERCFCPFNWPARIYVIDGRVVGVEYLDHFMTHDEKPDLRRHKTIDGYIQLIKNSIKEDPIQLSVSYNWEYGYPVRFEVDPEAFMADDEFAFEITSFTPIRPKQN